jgi:molybdopterin converting factor small subunit
VEETLKVKIKLYGASAGGLEKHELELDLHEGATVRDAVERLPVGDRVYLYVVREGIHLDEDARLQDRDELLVFPPVTGGRC